MHLRDEADHGLDAHIGKPAQPPDEFAYLLAILADVEGERAGILDPLVIPTLGLAMLSQDVELLGDLRGRAQASA